MQSPTVPPRASLRRFDLLMLLLVPSMALVASVAGLAHARELQQVLALLAERLSSLSVAPAPAPAKRGKAMPTEGPALAMALREEQLKQALEEFSDRLLGKPKA